MKILILTHANKDYDPDGINNAWEYYPNYFSKMGAKIKVVHKKEWYLYPLISFKFKPDIVISIGKITGLVTALHRMFVSSFCKIMFVHDLTDHPYFYKSDKRIKFIVKNHDTVTTSSLYNLKKFGCNFLVPNGSDFKPIKLNKKEIKWDACYLGQVHSFYGISKLIRNCKAKGIKLKIINNVASKDVPYYIARSKICVYPISWDSSTKICDYAAMSKPIVAVKPNLSEKIGLPAYYCDDLVKGIKYLLDHKEIADKLGKKSRKWFLNFTSDWEKLSKRYLDYLCSEYDKKLGKNKIFTMDVEENIDNGVKFAKLLTKKGLVGEFYMTGKLVEKYPEKVKQIAKLNHIIGGHGYDHEDFTKLSYKEAKNIIKKTIDIFRKNEINVVGWRFPGLSFKNNQLNILVEHSLYDSSIRDEQLSGWGYFMFIRNWLKNMKNGIFSIPYLFPKEFVEKTWSYADLNNKKFYKKSGRLITHCYKFDEFKDFI